MPVIVAAGSERVFLAPLEVAALRERLPAPSRLADDLPKALERLGVRTLGELAALPRAAVADRFGAAGHAGSRPGERRGRAAAAPPAQRGTGRASRAARFGLRLTAGKRALELLVDRLLARRDRKGRSFRRLRLEARLAAGGGWRSEATLRQASVDPLRLRLALVPKLGELPAPAATLGLRVLSFGPSSHEQPTLVRSDRERRRELLGEAVRHARAAGGRDAVLRVLEVDPTSRVPERRVVLTPFPES